MTVVATDGGVDWPRRGRLLDGQWECGALHCWWPLCLERGGLRQGHCSFTAYVLAAAHAGPLLLLSRIAHPPPPHPFLFPPLLLNAYPTLAATRFTRFSPSSDQRNGARPPQILRGGGPSRPPLAWMIGFFFISKTRTHPSGGPRDAGPRLTRTSHSTFRPSNACGSPANPPTSKASRSTTTTSRTTSAASPARTAASRSRSPAASPAGARCSNLGSRRPTPPPRASVSPTGCTRARSRWPSRDTCAQV